MSVPLSAAMPFFAAAAASVETDILTATLTPANISGQGSNERGYNAPSSNGSISANTFTFDGTAYTVECLIGRGGTRQYSDILICIKKTGVTAQWPKGDLDGVWFDPGINDLAAVNLGTVPYNGYTVSQGANGFSWWEGANQRRGFGVHQARPRVDANQYIVAPGTTYDFRLFTKS